MKLKKQKKVKPQPERVKDKKVEGDEYEYVPGLFEKEEEDFHPIQSENLNQSF